MSLYTDGPSSPGAPGDTPPPIFMMPLDHLIYKLKKLECFSKSCRGAGGVSTMLGVELALGVHVMEDG